MLLRDVERALIRLSHDSGNSGWLSPSDPWGERHSGSVPPGADGGWHDRRSDSESVFWSAGLGAGGPDLLAAEEQPSFIGPAEGSDYITMWNGRIVFSIWKTERHIREHPDLLSGAGAWVLISGIGVSVFCGGTAGVIFRAPSVGSMLGGACIGSVVGWIATKAFLARRRIFHMDTERFLEDVLELQSAGLQPRQKLDWLRYLWRFYRLDEHLVAT